MKWGRGMLAVGWAGRGATCRRNLGSPKAGSRRSLDPLMGKSGFSKLAARTGEPAVTWLMGTALARPELISLAAGFTDSATLPVNETLALMDELLGAGGPGRRALQYGTTAGDPELRRLTAAHVAGMDGGEAGPDGPYDPERLCITSGSQQLLYMLSECLCDPGDIVLVEDPTYFVYLGITQSHGLRCRGIRLETDGIDLVALDRVLGELRARGELDRVKLLYLVTYHQNPTGVSTAGEKKAEVLRILGHYERAAGHPIYLLEDAAYRELRFRGADIRSALTVAGARERVIYSGTYSKPFATGVRVGFGILPRRLRGVVMRVKSNHDFGTSNLLQQLVRSALASGVYGRHLEVLRARYAAKAGVMCRALRAHFPGEVEWREPTGGLYVWARLPRRIRTGVGSKLFKSALRHDVLYVPGDLCYAEDPTRRRPDHEMRISFGGEPASKLPEGVARLGKTLKEMMGA
jgi:2-aminoadipate transaminase